MNVLAYGKVNLALAVVGRRSDGYHEIDSIVQTIDLADRIAIEWVSSGISVENDLGPFSGADLAERAARGILEEKGIDAGVSIRINKGIPIGAGLGGGSSDAAAVLAALDRMTPPMAMPERIRDLAVQIGSDVALFLQGGRLRIRGRGEAIVRLGTALPASYVLLLPPISCETGAVYRRWDELNTAGHGLDSTDEIGRNDLTGPTLSLHPALAVYADGVRSIGADAAGMSGSGSAFYAVFRDHSAGGRAATVLERQFPEARVALCRATARGWREAEGDA